MLMAGSLQAADGGAERECLELLRESRTPAGRSAEFFERGLAEAAPRAVPALVQVLVDGQVPALEDGERVQTLSQPQRTLVLGALEHADPAQLLSRVPGLTEGDEPSERELATAVLLTGLARDVDGLSDVLGWSAERPESRWASPRCDALEWALASWLERGQKRTLSALSSHVGLLMDHQATRCAKVLADHGSPMGLEVMLSLAERFPAVRTEVLAHARRLGSSGRKDLDQEWGSFLIPLLGSGEENLARAAALTLGAFDHPDSVATLVRGMEDATCAQEAHWALQQLTGLRMPHDVQRWQRWYAGEEKFFHAEYDQCRQALHGPNDARAVAAIRELSRHRLRRHEIAEELGAALLGAPDTRRRLLCNAIEATGSLEGVGALLLTIEDRDETTRAAAYKALVAITGMDLPEEPEVWRVELEDRLL